MLLLLIFLKTSYANKLLIFHRSTSTKFQDDTMNDAKAHIKTGSHRFHIGIVDDRITNYKMARCLNPSFLGYLTMLFQLLGLRITESDEKLMNDE